jgi:hypothetical protein
MAMLWYDRNVASVRAAKPTRSRGRNQFVLDAWTPQVRAAKAAAKDEKACRKAVRHLASLQEYRQILVGEKQTKKKNKKNKEDFMEFPVAKTPEAMAKEFESAEGSDSVRAFECATVNRYYEELERKLLRKDSESLPKLAYVHAWVDRAFKRDKAVREEVTCDRSFDYARCSDDVQVATAICTNVRDAIALCTAVRVNACTNLADATEIIFSGDEGSLVECQAFLHFALHLIHARRKTYTYGC